MSEKLPPYLPQKFDRVHLELTNRCNFSCVFCPDGKMTRPRGIMETELAFSALDQIKDLDLAEKVTFHVMGEPLLHPQFFEILDHACSRDINIGLTTNGALLTPKVIEALAERSLYQIDISLQSPDAESFHATRGTKMDFGKYQDRMLNLLAACSSRPDPPIFKIRIMTTRFARSMRDQLGIPDFCGTSKQLRETVAWWTERVYEKLGIDGIDRSRALDKIGTIGIHGWNVIEIRPKVFIETYVLTDWGNVFTEDEIVEANFGYCFGMRDHFAILYNGDVALCCVDYDGETAIGNLQKTSLVEILRSSELERIVKGFKSYRLVHPYCRRCLGTDSWLGSWFKPGTSVLGLKILKPFFYRQYRLFE